MRRPTSSIWTGGSRHRDLVNVLDMHRLDGPVGQRSSMANAFDAGGPLDAACILPAGSMCSTDSTDWRGRSVASVTEIHR